MISAYVDRPLGRLNAVSHSVELGDTEAACSKSPRDINPPVTMQDAVAMLHAALVPRNLPTEAKARGSDRLKRSQPASPIRRYPLFDVVTFTFLGR